MASQWEVDLSRDAKKQYKNLTRSGLKPSITAVIDALVADLKLNGPVLINWPNYGVIYESKKRSYYHCHLRKRKPTYVACWELINEQANKIEVFYVGSHEDAPY